MISTDEDMVLVVSKEGTIKKVLHLGNKTFTSDEYANLLEEAKGNGYDLELIETEEVPSYMNISYLNIMDTIFG